MPKRKNVIDILTKKELEKFQKFQMAMNSSKSKTSLKLHHV